jgi:DNA polymerase elongation subunit (family B)
VRRISPTTSTPLYGLDIETDTTENGLDPAVARVVAVALVSDTGETVYIDDDEGRLLRRLDTALALATPGVLVTWNGGAFDLPFLASRAHTCGVPLGLRLGAAPHLPVRSPLPGHDGAYHGGWYAHRHVDAYRVWRSDLPRLCNVSCSLKAVAGLNGLDAIEVDVEHLHTLPVDVLHSYVASDARLARELARRRWSYAAGFTDPAPVSHTTVAS